MNSIEPFTIDESNLETGLRGIPVGYCPTSQVHPELGLTYRGYHINKIAYEDPEKVIYLLFYGNFPNAQQLDEFKNKLATYHLDSSIVDHLKSLPQDGHPMKWFLSAINFMGMIQSKNDWEEDCFQTIALIPEVVALIYRIRSGWGEPIASNPKLGYMENFVHMLSPPDQAQGLTELFRVFDVLHFDHGGGNLSTFAGKVVASGNADMYESLTAAMAGLAGPLHGKANQECLRFIKKINREVENPNDEEQLEKYLYQLIETKQKVYGFGHAVLRVEDQRAAVQYELGQKIASSNQLFNIALKLRTVGPKVLSTIEKIQNPYPNVDAVSGTLLNALGLEDEDYYTVLFGMSRCVGIACQIYYERVLARNGKGTPIVRPKYIYSGPVH